MKIAVFVLLLTIGLTQAKYLNNRYHRIRTIRDAASSIVRPTEYLVAFVDEILEECKKKDSSENELTDSVVEELKECLDEKTIFLDTKEEFADNLKECSKEFVEKAKNCLGEDLGYFPQLIVDFQNAINEFFYDDKDVIKSHDVRECTKHVQAFANAYDLQFCLHAAEEGIETTNDVPNTKADACTMLQKQFSCFPKMYSDECISTPDLDKFVEDYNKAAKSVCSDE